MPLCCRKKANDKAVSQNSTPASEKFNLTNVSEPVAANKPTEPTPKVTASTTIVWSSNLVAPFMANHRITAALRSHALVSDNQLQLPPLAAASPVSAAGTLPLVVSSMKVAMKSCRGAPHFFVAKRSAVE